MAKVWDPNTQSYVESGPAPAAPAVPRAPSVPGVTINMGNSGSSETESKTVTTRSPTTTRKVETAELKKAAAAADKADQAARTATVQKYEAEQKFEQEAIAHDEAKAVQEWENQQNEQRKREALETAHRQRLAAATEAEDAADQRVQDAQNKAINWDDRKAPMKILHALLRAGSTRDALLTGRDPANSPVIRSLDSALAAEKEKKRQLFVQSKEYRDALKTKNAERIKKAYDLAMTEIDMEVNKQAKALLQSDKTHQLAQRASKNDPNGQLWQANRDGMLAEIDQRIAKANKEYQEKWVPTVESGGTVTTTVDKTVSKTGIDGGPPRPLATVPDVEQLKAAEEAAADAEKLAATIEKNTASWTNVQKADHQHRREEAGNIRIPGVGEIGAGQVLRGLSEMVPPGLTRAYGGTPSGLTVESKLRDDKTGQEIWRGITGVINKEARAMGGAVTESDLRAKREEMGIEGQDAKTIAGSLRARAAKMRERAAQIRAQKTFLPTP